MANKIRGITLEISGNTQPLNKALTEVNKKSKDLQSELKQVDRLLKLDPKNTILVEQKQKLLTEAVENTKNKLDTLKTAEKQVQQQFERGEIGADQYREIQREVITTENNLKSLEQQLNNTNNKWKSAADSINNFGTKTEALGKKLAPVSAVAGAGLAGMAGMAVEAGKTADDLNTLSKTTGLTTASIQKLQYASAIIDVDFETVQGSLTKLTRTMGDARDGTASAEEAFARLGVSFKNELTGELRSNEDVFYEAIEALGAIENQTERDALAMDIFGKSAQELNPLILGGADALKKMGDEAENRGLIISQEELDKANEFNDVIDQVSAEGKQTMMELGVEIGKALLPVLEKLSDGISNVMDWMRGLDEGTMQTIMTVLAVVAAVAPVLIVVGKVATGISALMTLGTTLGPILGGVTAAFGTISAPVLIVVAAVAALIAIGVALYKNWDTIKEKAGALKEKIKNLFDFEWKLPDLKLPHFGIKGEFSLNPPSIPSLSVDWYKEGSVFTKPNVIGVGEGGEPEGVFPLSYLNELIGSGGNSTVNHTGTIRVEGVNNRGELVAVVEQEITNNIVSGNRRIPNRTSLIPI